MLRFVAVFLLVLALGPAGASGQAGPSDAEVERRLEFLEERLDASRRRGQYWFYGWGAVMGGSVIANGVRAGLDDSEDHRTMALVEVGKATLGLADLMLRPLEARHGADSIRSMPSATPEQRLRQLEAAEARLEANAERSDNRWHWQPHAGALVVNLAALGIVGGIGDWSDAAISFTTGMLGAEARIWTEPSRPRRDWEDYQSFKATGRTSSKGGLAVVPQKNGLAVKWTF